MGNRIAAGAICCTLIARRSAGVVLLDCALAEPLTPNRAAAMVMARKRRRLRRLWLISSNIDLSPIGKQSPHKHYPATSQGVRRYSVTVTDPVSTKLVTTLMLPRVALVYGHVWCAPSTRAWATSRSKLGRLTLRRAWRK